MFAGHLAVGLVLKKMERRISLGWLFFAVLFHDFLLGILTLAGLEQIQIPANYAQRHYQTFTFPYSHSLTASIVWSLLAFVITFAVYRHGTSKQRQQAGAAMGVAVFSHFVLDWIVHVPDLPLIGNNSPKIGFGLWNHLAFALALETALVVLGYTFYLVMVKPRTKLARYGIGTLLVFLTAMTVLGMGFSETPPPAMGQAITWIIQPFLICGLAFWFESK